MREVAFLKQNAAKWKQLESILTDRSAASPDTLAGLFVQVTDDLAYARTFYPNSKATLYLNALAGKVHQAIYRNRKERKNRIVLFWAEELPALFRRSHPQLLQSFIIFMLAVCIGAVSAANDQTFVRLILGDGYVNMTLENIKKGDPLAVYKGEDASSMFFGITLNNIRVSFIAFVFGVLCSVGTVYVLISNGIMLGAFQTFFYQYGLLYKSFLVIWIHGTLEISAIVIAGCAGLVVGNSILFPGTYSRTTSFRRGAWQGLKIVMGLVPIFITAGFLESFVTRYTEMPEWLSLLIIGSSLAFILWYFVWYPIELERRNLGIDLTEDEPLHTLSEENARKKIEFRRKRDLAEILTITFEFARQHLKPLGKAIVFIAGPAIIVSALITGWAQASLMSSLLGGSGANESTALWSIGFNTLLSVVVGLVTGIFVLTTVQCYIALYMKQPPAQSGQGQSSPPIEVSDVWQAVKKELRLVAAGSVGSLAIVIIGLICFIVPGIYLLVPLSLIVAVQVSERLPFRAAVSRCLSLVSNYWWQTGRIMSIMALLLSVLVAVFAIPQQILTLLVTIQSLEKGGGESVVYTALLVALTVFRTIAAYLLNALLAIALSFQYFNLVERKEARGLLEKIDRIAPAEPPVAAAPEKNRTLEPA